jgi:hypothetical protein
LHVSGTLPLHCVAPGVQVPVQTPLEHAEQVATSSQAVPVELHTSTMLPSQRCVCAVQVVVVVQAPLEQPCEHTCCWTHICDELQTCSTLPLHWVAPGVQGGVAHAAPVHVSPLGHAVAAPQSLQPFAWIAQVWTCDPEHCVAPTVQSLVQQAPALQVPFGQACAGFQSVQPFACCAQVWSCGPEHCVAPTVHWFVQLLAHCPPEHVSPEGHATAVPQLVHPFDCTLHVSRPPPLHWVAPSTHSFAQARTHWLPTQVSLVGHSPGADQS